MKDLKRQIEFLYKPGDTFEVCLIGPPVRKNPLWNNDYAGKIISGWFVDIDKAVSVVNTAENVVKPVGIYLTLNPCNAQMRAVSDQKLKAVQTRTPDKFIERIENFFIDVDPIKPSGTSSSVDQLAYALEKAFDIRDELPDKEGCMMAMSGNGYHLVYKAKGMGTEDIKKVLNYASDKYSDENVSVDTSVFNPARLIKAYGTTARKGVQVKSLYIEHRKAFIKDGCDGNI